LGRNNPKSAVESEFSNRLGDLREDDEDVRMAPPPLWGKSTPLSLNRQRPWDRCER
jgi:hypothetical protein